MHTQSNPSPKRAARDFRAYETLERLLLRPQGASYAEIQRETRYSRDWVYAHLDALVAVGEARKDATTSRYYAARAS